MPIEANFADAVLHHIGRTAVRPSLVVIGAMDGVSFDHLYWYGRIYKWSGLYVEPIPEQFRRLQQNFAPLRHAAANKYENSAIAEHDGTIHMLTIDQGAIDSGAIHPCFGGMSAIYPPRNGLASEGDAEVVTKYGALIDVPCLTLPTLFKRHAIDRVDIMSVDAEGWDYKIIRQLDLAAYRPKFIRCEYINLAPDEQAAIVRLFTDHQYVVRVEGQNIDATPAEYWADVEASLVAAAGPSAAARATRPARTTGAGPQPKCDACFVTSIMDDEPLKWGLEPERIAVPMVLFCSPAMARRLREGGVSPDAIIVPTERPEPRTPHDKLAALHAACTAACHDADRYFWLDSTLLYQFLSFEFLYSGVLSRAIGRLGPDAMNCPMPGFRADAFFGGPRRLLMEAYERLDAVVTDPVASTEVLRYQASLFPNAWGDRNTADLNLNLAAAIDEPIVHVIGDSHVQNGFAPNRAVGCRPNVLVHTGDVSNIPVPYPFQFTHHLGGRTMHQAGKDGALLAAAAECGVRRGDAVVWVFGEIDVRSHILRRHQEDGRSVTEIIDTLARNFLRGVVEVRAKYAPLVSVVFAPIPPLDSSRSASQDLPVHGTLDERVAVTRQLRAALAALCARDGILFLDVAAQYETARGDLRWALSDGVCHIAHEHQGPIVDGLYQLLTDAGRRA